MKELSSSNHPTHSSTNIETQIPPVNLSQSKKDSSKSDHSTHSPTKNESGVSLKDADPLSKETTNKLSTKRSSPDRTHSPSTEKEHFSINTTTSPQNDKSSVHNSPVNVDSTIKKLVANHII